MSHQKGTSLDWSLWFLWIMATALGWIVGGFLVGPVGMVASGVAIGVLQWLVLKQHIRRDWQWILATSGGWVVGWGIAFAALPLQLDFVSGFLIGTTTGMAQWLILRKEVHWAGWWVVISALAWSTGLNLMPGFLTSGVLPGAITGIALALLLCYPKSQGHAAEEESAGRAA